MSTYKLIKLSRGNYQVIRPDGIYYFKTPVSKWKGSQAIQDEIVHARLLADSGIRKAVVKLIDRTGIKITTVDNLIYQYSYQLYHKDMRAMMRRPSLFTNHIVKTMGSDRAARLASIGTDKYKHCNHHHELTDNDTIVDFGDGEFVANKAGIPLLKALNEAGLRTRTHHYTGEGQAFVSILLEGIRIEVKEVHERDADRDKYNGKMELLICWEVGK